MLFILVTEFIIIKNSFNIHIYIFVVNIGDGTAIQTSESAVPRTTDGDGAKVRHGEDVV